MVDKAPDPCFLVNRDGLVLYANAACGQAVDSPVVGRFIYETSPPERREQTRRNVERAFSTGENVRDHILYQGQGQEYWFSMRYVPIFSDRGAPAQERGVRYVGVVALDETEQRLVERALARSETRYRHLIENSLDIIAVIDAGLIAFFVSSNVTEHMGWSTDELHLMCLRELVHPEDVREVDRKLERLRQRPARPQALEVRLRRKDGTYATLEAQARLLEQAPAQSPRFVVNCRDITERKESERLRQNLFRADKLAAIGQLAAGVAHEINNPASFITTNLYMLREYIDTFRALHDEMLELFDELPDEVRGRVMERVGRGRPTELLGEMNRMLEANLEGMERIRLIVQDLRSFSRDEPEKNETVDLNEVVRAACNMVKNQAAYVAELVVELGEVPLVVGDSSKLHQVVLNLLVNAVHAVSETDNNGHADHRIVVRTFNEDGQVMVEVEDTGCGIVEHARERVFEPFYTTKPPEQGTGLGLWMCAEIVRKHRGTLSHEPREGGGTRFIVCMPDETPPDARHDRSSGEFERARPPVEPVRVLVIDDDELVLDSYQKLFSGQHEITIALGGRQAVEILRERDDFDVVLCDVVMPDVDGIAVHEHMAMHRPHLLPRTVFCTAGAFTARTRIFSELVREQLVYKPLTPRQLDELIRRVASRD